MIYTTTLRNLRKIVVWGNDFVGDSPMASCPISEFGEVVSHKSDYIGSSLSAKLPDDH